MFWIYGGKTQHVTPTVFVCVYVGKGGGEGKTKTKTKTKRKYMYIFWREDTGCRGGNVRDEYVCGEGEVPVLRVGNRMRGEEILISFFLTFFSGEWSGRKLCVWARKEFFYFFFLPLSKST